jgi:hypothetical protein
MKLTLKHINKLFIILFLIVLVVPTIIQVFGLEKISHSENRNKADFPKLHTIKKPKQFVNEIKTFYKDNFGLRNTLSDFYINFKTTTLHESPIPSKVIIGKKGVLFLGNSFSNVINESLGFDLFSERELSKIKSTILERKNWLKSQNIAFYVAVVPNKHSVYRELLPFKAPIIQTRKDQLINYLKSSINFNLIDLGAQFKTKKLQYNLYRKFDTHWNDIGAFFGYQTLIDCIKTDFNIERREFSEYYTKKVILNGELGKMITLFNKDTVSTLNAFHPDKIDTILMPKYYSKKNIYEDHFKNSKKTYKVLFLRDSFSSAMKQFFNQTFGECTFIWTHKFDKEIILKEKPDIVVMEYVERYLEALID